MKQLFKLQEKIEKLKLQRDKARAEVQRLRTVQVTQDPPAEYGIKEMHIDCEKKDFEVGKWYKERYNSEDSVLGLFSKKGDLNIGSINSNWCLDVNMTDFKYWQEMTPEEVKEVLTIRCKELGLFDGEFECFQSSNWDLSKNKEPEYWRKEDMFWIGGNVAYSKGKFAKLVDKKNIATTADIPESMLKFAVSDFGGRFYFNHTQLSEKSREYLSQFENVVIE